MSTYSINQRVRIQKPESWQHDRTGKVVGYEDASNSYFLDLDGQFIQVSEEFIVDGSMDWSGKNE